MLKSLETKHNDRDITLQCTHRKKFPPPQMYGHTAEDVDKMWKQGAIDQNMHQSLTVWRDMCGLFQMGPKCLGCEHALLEKPRPGRPNVVETENWLGAKRQMLLEDRKAKRILPEDRETPEAPDPGEPSAPRLTPKIKTGNTKLGLAATKVQAEFEAATAAEATAMVELAAKVEIEKAAAEEPKKPMIRTGSPVPVSVVSEEPEPEETEDEAEVPLVTLVDETIEDPSEEEEEVDDDIIEALADD
jgi:hypothetical protein